MAYEPKKIEEKTYRAWERAKAFQPAVKKPRGKKPFSIVLPPPNVTGSLHMGHALNASMQDVLTRYHRMKGDDTVWVPGMDHAGIATQNVVEKQLRKEGLTRHDLGREKFLERVWQWKEQYGKTIGGQLRNLGVSCDWSRERFTMDAGYVRAVSEAFIHYAQKGLIYRGDRIVNWCPRCASSISDLEVVYEEREGFIYNIIYPLADGSGSITVATTRPETMLGDTGVAVYPKDDRYKKLVGKKVKLPLTDREIPIVADHAVEKEFGTGAVKVTPAHDLTDWEIGSRQKLEIINVIGEDGKMTNKAGEKYAGLTVEEAGKKVLEDLKLGGYLSGEPQKLKHNVAICERCGTIIQPLVSKQWFVKMAPLSGPAMEVAKKNLINFHPIRWKKIYLDWLGGVKDWCVSRQLWWGHRLPVWYCQTGRISKTDGHVVFSAIKPKKCPECGGKNFEQDPDVLDTWFSSALWPFAVFGWPEMTDDLARFYPTSVLTTARDIVALWVARMVFSGLEFTNAKKYLPAKQYGKKNLGQQISFRDVIIHPTVLNSKGQRMSKSLGTGIDPMNLINEYGADATRFGLLVQTQQDQQALRFDENAVRTGRNFVNKLWNIGKFIENANSKGRKSASPTIFDQWILDRLNQTAREVTFALKEFRFGDAVRSLHAFVWDDFADWYIEVSKIDGMTDRKTAKNIFQNILKLAHPFIPFVTEELWKEYGDGKNMLIVSSWPNMSTTKKKIGREMQDFQNIVKELRSTRSLLGIPANQEPTIYLKVGTRLRFAIPAVAYLISFSAILDKPEKDWVKLFTKSGLKISLPRDIVASLPLDARLASLNSEAEKIKEEITSIESRLRQMAGKAPKDVIAEQKKNLQTKKTEMSSKKEGIKELQSLISGVRAK
jgi:valyl-tRNA synthetase